MRFNPIDFFYNLFSGNPYLIGAVIVAVIISLIPNSLCEFILELPTKIKRILEKKPVDVPNQQANQNYDFLQSDNNYFTFKGRIRKNREKNFYQTNFTGIFRNYSGSVIFFVVSRFTKQN